MREPWWWLIDFLDVQAEDGRCGRRAKSSQCVRGKVGKRRMWDGNGSKVVVAAHVVFTWTLQPR
jgi:hypothetical protein